MRARPDVKSLAAVSVPATRNGRPRDDIESDQEVARTLRSIVHASTAPGVEGEGSGGVTGGGEPGSGGQIGPGSTWASDRPGLRQRGGGISTRTTRASSRTSEAFTRSSTRSWAHAFPLRAAPRPPPGGGHLRGHDPPANGETRVDYGRRCDRAESRSSTRTASTAIRRASPFDPIPASLGTRELHVRMPFDAQNPVVK